MRRRRGIRATAGSRALAAPAGPARSRQGRTRRNDAPGHTSIKSIARYLQRMPENPAVRFVGGVEFGSEAGAMGRDTGSPPSVRGSP